MGVNTGSKKFKRPRKTRMTLGMEGRNSSLLSVMEEQLELATSKCGSLMQQLSLAKRKFIGQEIETSPMTKTENFNEFETNPSSTTKDDETNKECPELNNEKVLEQLGDHNHIPSTDDTSFEQDSLSSLNTVSSGKLKTECNVFANLFERLERGNSKTSIRKSSNSSAKYHSGMSNSSKIGKTETTDEDETSSDKDISQLYKADLINVDSGLQFFLPQKYLSNGKNQQNNEKHESAPKEIFNTHDIIQTDNRIITAEDLFLDGPKSPDSSEKKNSREKNCENGFSDHEMSYKNILCEVKDHKSLQNDNVKSIENDDVVLLKKQSFTPNKSLMSIRSISSRKSKMTSNDISSIKNNVYLYEALRQNTSENLRCPAKVKTKCVPQKTNISHKKNSGKKCVITNTTVFENNPKKSILKKTVKSANDKPCFRKFEKRLVQNPLKKNSLTLKAPKKYTNVGKNQQVIGKIQTKSLKGISLKLQNKFDLRKNDKKIIINTPPLNHIIPEKENSVPSKPTSSKSSKEDNASQNKQDTTIITQNIKETTTNIKFSPLIASKPENVFLKKELETLVPKKPIIKRHIFNSSLTYKDVDFGGGGDSKENKPRLSFKAKTGNKQNQKTIEPSKLNTVNSGINKKNQDEFKIPSTTFLNTPKTKTSSQSRIDSFSNKRSVESAKSSRKVELTKFSFKKQENERIQRKENSQATPKILLSEIEKELSKIKLTPSKSEHTAVPKKNGEVDRVKSEIKSSLPKNNNFSRESLVSPNKLMVLQLGETNSKYNLFPFILGQSTGKSYNLGVNIQQTMSMLIRSPSERLIGSVAKIGANVSSRMSTASMATSDRSGKKTTARVCPACVVMPDREEDVTNEISADPWDTLSNKRFIRCTCMPRKTVHIQKVMKQLLLDDSSSAFPPLSELGTIHEEIEGDKAELQHIINSVDKRNKMNKVLHTVWRIREQLVT